MMFQPDHIDQIRSGDKTQTRRAWDRKHVSEGGVYIADPEMFCSHEEADCYVQVTGIRIERLGDMTEADAEAEGNYTLDEFRQLWEEINETEWDPLEEVYVIEFEYVGREHPGR